MRGLLLALVMLLSIFAGCVQDSGDAAERQEAKKVVRLQPQPYYKAQPDVLTDAKFKILPMVTTRVKSSLDGINLFVEIHRPDTQEPVPTILHSSPYNALERVPGQYPTQGFPQANFIRQYVPRGYAVVVADVRGFGESDGCVEVWGKNEQQDQYDLVEWIAKQSWSNGKVGMVGVSYPGTTPMEAAVMAPPHLTTIVAVAGLTDPYFDWHYGGVPNGESYGSPAAYQGIGAVAPVDIPGGADWVKAAVNAGCGLAPLVTGAYQPDGRYTSYYAERNLSARAQNVKASVLYTQGFIDGNVKPSQALNWFNALNTTKKGIFGQWAHSYPQRSDYLEFMHAWFDDQLMGRNTGILSGPFVEVTTNRDTWRADTHWPPVDSVPLLLYLDASKKGLGRDAPAQDAVAGYRADRVVPGNQLDSAPRSVVFESQPLDREVHIAGVPSLRFNATITGDKNVFYYAEVHLVRESGAPQRIVFGALNAALRENLTTYKPVPEGQVVEYSLPFQPREFVLLPGEKIRLTLTTSGLTSSLTPEATRPVNVLVHTGPKAGSALVLPILENPQAQPLPYDK